MNGALRRVRRVLGPLLQTSLAAGLAWYVAHDLIGHRQPFFAPIAAAVALSTSHVQRSRRSVQMVAGVLLGIAVAELLHPLVGSGAISIGVVVFVSLLLAVGLGFGFFGEGMMFFNQAAASAILVIALHRSGTGSERAVDALVGGAVALVIGVGIFPSNPLKLIWEAEEGVLRSLRGVLSSGRLSGSCADEEMDWALSASHEVHARLAALTQARNTARVTVRVAPRRMPMRGVVEAEEGRMARMNLLAGGVLALMRTRMDIAETRGGPSARCEQEIGELGAALDELLRARRPWSGGVVAEVSRRMRALRERAADGVASPGAVLATALRRVAQDIIELLPEGGAER